MLFRTSKTFVLSKLQNKISLSSTLDLKQDYFQQTRLLFCYISIYNYIIQFIIPAIIKPLFDIGSI